ncbi:DUF7546 family protein [Halostella salina]|uniref:DUF7546 family protein n=1 Tax=Halostella salina TaxID=1547897 RepID=UPI000EF824DD|nr:hypothetical protein [Halostella salina]
MTAVLGTRDGASLGPLARAARTFVLLTAVELLVVAAYFATTDARVISARYLVYPFVWVNVTVLAVSRTTLPPLAERRTWLAAVAAVGYFALLAWAGGLISFASAGGGGRLAVRAAAPGWGPILVLSDSRILVTLVPFKTVGYVGLAALVYAALADTSRTAVSGVLGLATCVSCTGSVVGTLLAGTAGGSAVAVSELFVQSYDLSTVVFLLTVAALWLGVRR